MQRFVSSSTCLALLISLTTVGLAEAGITIESKCSISELRINEGKDADGFEQWTYAATYEGGEVLEFHTRALQNFMAALQAPGMGYSCSFPKTEKRKVTFKAGPGLAIGGNGGEVFQLGSFKHPGFTKLRAVRVDSPAAAVFELTFEEGTKLNENDMQRLQGAITYLASSRYANRGTEWFTCSVSTPDKTKVNVKHFTVNWRETPAVAIDENTRR